MLDRAAGANINGALLCGGHSVEELGGRLHVPESEPNHSTRSRRPICPRRWRDNAGRFHAEHPSCGRNLVPLERFVSAHVRCALLLRGRELAVLGSQMFLGIGTGGRDRLERLWLQGRRHERITL